MSTTRLREIAFPMVLHKHVLSSDDDGSGHRGRFDQCPHPDCVLVRAGDALSAAPAAPVAHPVDASVPPQASELDELERRLIANEPQLQEHTRAWALVAIRRLRRFASSWRAEAIDGTAHQEEARKVGHLSAEHYFDGRVFAFERCAEAAELILKAAVRAAPGAGSLRARLERLFCVDNRCCLSGDWMLHACPEDAEGCIDLLCSAHPDNLEATRQELIDAVLKVAAPGAVREPQATFGCHFCGCTFDGPVQHRWSIGGIPTRTFFFCSAEHITAWLNGQPWSPAPPGAGAVPQPQEKSTRRLSSLVFSGRGTGSPFGCWGWRS